MAAGAVAGWGADSIFGAGTWDILTATGADIAAKAFAGALTGAASGVISSVVYGQNIEKGLYKGALAGLEGAAVGAAAGWAIEKTSILGYFEGDQNALDTYKNAAYIRMTTRSHTPISKKLFGRLCNIFSVNSFFI